MSKFNSWSKEKRCLVATSVFLAFVFIVLLIASILSNKYGLVVGWSIGSAITLITQALMFESGKLIASNAMESGKGTALVIIFYAARFILYAAALVICALFQFHSKAKISSFNFSLYTCVAALIPSHLFIAAFYRDKEDKKIEEKK